MILSVSWKREVQWADLLHDVGEMGWPVGRCQCNGLACWKMEVKWAGLFEDVVKGADLLEDGSERG